MLFNRFRGGPQQFKHRSERYCRVAAGDEDDGVFFAGCDKGGVVSEEEHRCGDFGVWREKAGLAEFGTVVLHELAGLGGFHNKLTATNAAL